jgi:uncharacterized protein GlcG (DUF336 family)
VSRFISKRRTAGLVAIMVACIAGASAYAFTATNTVQAHSAGVGSGAVSGFIVTPSGTANYTFNGAGTTVLSVQFALDKAATDVAAALTASPVTADWVHCTTAPFLAGDPITCTFGGGGVPVGNAVKLSIAAVSTGTLTIGA